MTSKKRFIFSTDSYHPESIKTQERLRRGCGEQFILDGSATRRPKDFKSFLTNDANKKQLCEVLLKVWGSSAAASRLEKFTDAVVIVDGTAHRLQYSNKQVKFLVHFHFLFPIPFLIVYSSSTARSLFLIQPDYTSFPSHTPDTPCVIGNLPHNLPHTSSEPGVKRGLGYINDHYIVAFYFSGKCRGNTVDQIQPRRNGHSGCSVYTVC